MVSSGFDLFGGLNLFTQMTQPKEKEGIWIQTDRRFSQVVNDPNIYTKDVWREKGDYAKPFFRYIEILNTIRVDDFIYTITENYDVIYLYRYDINLNIWTQKSGPTTGNTLTRTSAYLDGYIYLLTTYENYRYKIANDTWEAIPNTTIQVRDHKAASIDGKLFQFFGRVMSGGYPGTNNIFELDPITKIWRQKKNAPYANYEFTICVAEGYVYIIGGYSNTRRVYRYNPSADIWTSITNAPFDIYDTPAVYRENNIYIIGKSNYSGEPYKNHRFNITDNTWTMLPTIPNGKTKGALVESEYGVDLLDLDYYYTLATEDKKYPENTFVISRKDLTGKYHTVLVNPGIAIGGEPTRLLSYFDEAYMFYDDAIQKQLPTYYGNGKAWVRFTN